MAMLLHSIALRCVQEYSLHLCEFYAGEALDIYGYCSDRLTGVLFEESHDRKPGTMGICIAQAVQDKDLEVAFARLAHLNRNGTGNALYRLQHDFEVVLAHEIKAVLLEQRGATAHI